MHSKAVDYVKTGEPANMPRDLCPRRWPHFMEKKNKPKERIYTSRGILGQLYDLVERVDFVPLYHSEFDPRILNAYDLEAGMLQNAREIKEKYDADMRRIMAQRGISTEFEVWSTFVLSHDHMSKDYKFHEEMGQIAFALKERYRDVCIEKAGGKGFDVLGPFVAAMYKVTQEEIAGALEETRQTIMVNGQTVPKRSLNASSMPLMSFPWCFTEILGKITDMGGVVPEGIQPLKPIEIGRGHGKEEKREKEVYAAEEIQTTDHQVENTRDTLPLLVNLQEDDVIETAAGVTHRGELLELFQNTDTLSPGTSESGGRNFQTIDVTPQNPASPGLASPSSISANDITIEQWTLLGSRSVSVHEYGDEPSSMRLSALGNSGIGVSGVTSKLVQENEASLEEEEGSEVDEEEFVTIEETDRPSTLEALGKLVLDSSQHDNA